METENVEPVGTCGQARANQIGTGGCHGKTRLTPLWEHALQMTYGARERAAANNSRVDADRRRVGVDGNRFDGGHPILRAVVPSRRAARMCGRQHTAEEGSNDESARHCEKQ